MIMAFPKLKPLPQRNDIIKFFYKINENIEVNRAPVRIRHSGWARDSSRDIFEKENLITRKIKRNKLSIPGFWFGLTDLVRLGSGVATVNYA